MTALYQSKAVIRALLDESYDRKRLRLICNAAPNNGPITADDLERFVGLPAYRFLPQAQGEAEECLQLCKLLPDGSALGRDVAALTRSIAGIPEPPGRERRGALSWLL